MQLTGKGCVIAWLDCSDYLGLAPKLDIRGSLTKYAATTFSDFGVPTHPAIRGASPPVFGGTADRDYGAQSSAR